MEQKYRDLTFDDTIQPGDEVWEFGDGPWEPVSVSEHGQRYWFGYWKMRRPVAAEEILKQQLESMTKSWYDQRAELADARNEITDLTRRLEDALSEKVIAEKSYHESRAERDELLTRQQAHHREAERLSVQNEELCAARYQLNTIKQAFQFIKKS